MILANFYRDLWNGYKALFWLFADGLPFGSKPVDHAECNAGSGSTR